MKQLLTALLFCLILIACQPAADVAAPLPVAPSPTSQPVTATSVPPTSTPTAPPSATPTPLPDPTATPAQAATPTTGGSALLGLVGTPPESLNPVLNSTGALRELTPLLFEALLRVDPFTAALQPGLAERWEYAADGQQVTFYLPDNLAWSDGTPFTAADVAASLQATGHPALLTFSNISAPDARTLTLTFLDIDCAAVTSVGLLPLLPAEQVTAPQPVGSGPFQWAEVSPQSLRLTRNSHYHGPAAFLDEITVRLIEPDDAPIVLSEGVGQFDAVGPLDELVETPADFERLTYPAAEMLYLALNDAPRNEPPLDPLVRQALLLALDRPEILAELLAGEGQLLAGSLLPSHWAANAALSPPPYDVEAAQLLLAESGLRDSDQDGWLDQDGARLDLPINLNGINARHQRLGWLVSGYYRDLGLFSRAESAPPDGFLNTLFTHDFQLAIFRWPILPDPDQRLYWLSTENEEGIGLNFTSFNNSRVDDLLAAGVAVPGCQPAERAKIYAEAQQLLSEARPVDFLLAPNRHLLVNRRLLGPTPGPFVPLTWNAATWHLRQ